MLFYPVNRLITNDSGDPSPQRTLTTIFKPMDGGQNAHKAILHHIFCRLTIWNIPKCCSHNISRKAVVQAMHCLPVSFMYRLKKLLFCLHRSECLLFLSPSGLEGHIDGCGKCPVPTLVCGVVCHDKPIDRCGSRPHILQRVIHHRCEPV